MTQACAVLLVVGMAGCQWCCHYHDRAGEPRLAIFRTMMGPRPGEDPHERAGYPREISPCAYPSDTGAYVAYPVGGGQAFARKGREPGVQEGVWGWDYCGRKIPSNVELLWGDQYQGGLDGYEKKHYPELLKAVLERHEKHEEHEEHEGGHEGGGHNGGSNAGGHNGGGSNAGGGHGGAGHE
jgi:hypothetical protein